LDRISKFLTAEELAEPYQIDQRHPLAVQVNGEFTWETVLGVKEEKGKAKENSNDDKSTAGKWKKKKTDKKATKDGAQSRWWKSKSKKTMTQDQLSFTADDSEITGNRNNDSAEKEEPPFSLNGLRFEVRKGAFVAIVGRVGCGKVSREITCP
jgi:ABC-type multidrug transport system fused ATPase/permease subunit